ncbi:MAG: hypothetical protein IJU19_05380 [Bacteroidales bacterium]|nr:hypothetical protein [Bacteroidales bacterium]
MMQQYAFLSPDTFSPTTACEEVCPSERVVRNILDFARSCQVVEVEGRTIEIYLN